jgi:mono/diheme cytochrome c family protein
VKRGEGLYAANCSVCHGAGAISGGVLPDLRHSAVVPDRAAFAATVLDGARKANGMPGFAGRLSAEDARDIRAYVLGKAAAAAKAGASGRNP